MKKHAHTAGLGAPARLRPVNDKSTGSGGMTCPTQNEAARHHYGTKAAIGTQHPDSDSLEQSSPAFTHRIKAKLIHCAAWLALVFRGVV